MLCKTIDLTLVMNVKNTHTPLVAEFVGKTHNLNNGKNTFDIQINKVNQIIQIQFSGFTYKKPGQEVQINLYYNTKKLDTKKISTFQMSNNKFVENKEIQRYDTIFFNGTLHLKFITSWIDMEIISGFNLCKDKNAFIDITRGHHNQVEIFNKFVQKNKNKTHYLALIGTCHQRETKKRYTPSLFTCLQNEYPNKSLLNYSSEGLNDWCILHNSFWALRNFKIKNLLITLNVGTYITSKLKVFDHVSYWPFLITPSNKRFKYKSQLKLYRFNRKRMSMWTKILNKKLDSLLQLCEKLEVTPIIFNYSPRNIWYNKNNYIDWRSEYVQNKNYHFIKQNEITNSNIIKKLKTQIK